MIWRKEKKKKKKKRKKNMIKGISLANMWIAFQFIYRPWVTEELN